MNSSINSKTHNDIQDLLKASFYSEILDRVSKTKMSTTDNLTPNRGARGRQIIEAIKQKNRESIAKMRGFDPEKIATSKDIISAQLEDNKKIIKKIRQKQNSSEWKSLKKKEIMILKNKIKNAHRDWRKKHLFRLKKWDLKKADYKKEMEVFRKKLSTIPLVSPVSKEKLKKKLMYEVDKDAFFVSNSLETGVRNQKSRPTCSAFSGIKVIEILLAQNGKKHDLSEQYFYWSSKPNCRNSKCRKRGSWVGEGLDYSKNISRPDIPLEKDCKYNPDHNIYNETQIPLSSECNKGSVKVENYSYLGDLDEVIDSLDKNIPVVSSLKLSSNFYNNSGLVLFSDNVDKNNMDSHAKGHSLVIIGYLKLPKILNEGKVCFVVLNSWGLGWGRGGYSCLSEKWLLNHRKSNPFVVVNKIQYVN